MVVEDKNRLEIYYRSKKSPKTTNDLSFNALNPFSNRFPRALSWLEVSTDSTDFPFQKLKKTLKVNDFFRVESETTIFDNECKHGEALLYKNNSSTSFGERFRIMKASNAFLADHPND